MKMGERKQIERVEPRWRGTEMIAERGREESQVERGGRSGDKGQ